MNNKKYIYVLSSMRAGSTLLKSLLSTRKEIVDLPEIPVHLINEIASLVSEDTVLIKRPRFYLTPKYPHFEFKEGSKIIILIRSPYDTILSLHKMNLENHFADIQYYNEQRLLDYWISTYQLLYKSINLKSDNVILVKYEDLTTTPLKTTENIFKFLDVSDITGINSYQKPKGYQWKWGFGDGGDVLKTLTVVNRQNKYLNKKLINLIDNNKAAKEVLKNYGY
ncbi:MAG: sulfotransferase [Algibacter sp.]